MDASTGKWTIGRNNKSWPTTSSVVRGSLGLQAEDGTAKKMDESIGKSLITGGRNNRSRRYAGQWTGTDNVGFAVADVSQARFKMAYYKVRQCWRIK
jgi:hypothetical protein